MDELKTTTAAETSQNQQAKEPKKARPKKVMRGTLQNPKQRMFIEYFTNPKSETFGKIQASGIKAGYSENTASQLIDRGSPELIEGIEEATERRARLLFKAENKLETLLNADSEPVQAQVAMHLTKTLGKAFYSERTEVTGANGGPITSLEIDSKAFEKILEAYSTKRIK